ncbi:phage holin family protein [Pelagicoccus sp. SDUM812003]|uniref:phage holin family protein n=1 Tax=Pelagicoccus sp. SDUM812003 TaxID=3041267 RepID=UPI00280F890E|nr:phage holin family protein [Pelagicoccus sp. SDUM812003]MDQ8203986.1 phage holin family protein [Pelagicoccus sp. SDUM812003]
MIGQQEPRSSHKPPLGSLFSDLRNEFAHLLRSTTQLFRQEMEENAENAAAGFRAALLGFGVCSMGALFTFLGIDLLAISLLAPEALSYETAAWVCTLSLALLLWIAGAILAKRSKNKLSPDQIIPKKTLSTIEEHAEWIANQAEEISK